MDGESSGVVVTTAASHTEDAEPQQCTDRPQFLGWQPDAGTRSEACYVGKSLRIVFVGLLAGLRYQSYALWMQCLDLVSQLLKEVYQPPCAGHLKNDGALGYGAEELLELPVVREFGTVDDIACFCAHSHDP